LARGAKIHNGCLLLKLQTLKTKLLVKFPFTWLSNLKYVKLKILLLKLLIMPPILPSFGNTPAEETANLAHLSTYFPVWNYQAVMP
jgi:hypothetical protein